MAAARVGRSGRRRHAPRSGRLSCAAQPWLQRRDGRRRRGAALRLRPRRRRGRERGRRARPRRRAAARVEPAWPMRSRARPLSTAPRCRPCRSSTRSSAPQATRRALGRSRRPGSNPDAAGRAPRAAARRLRARPAAAVTRTRPRCSRAAGIAVVDRSRRADQHQGHGSGGPRDRPRARAVPARTARNERIGFGEDTHGFGPGDGPVLGGVADRGRAAAVRPLGRRRRPARAGHRHPVGLRAGRPRPALPADATQRPTGSPAADARGEAVHQAHAAGWTVDRAQVSIVGARPRLGGRQARRDARRDRRAAGRIEAGSVSVTASTGNLSGAGGRGSGDQRHRTGDRHSAMMRSP